MRCSSAASAQPHGEVWAVLSEASLPAGAHPCERQRRSWLLRAPPAGLASCLPPHDLIQGVSQSRNLPRDKGQPGVSRYLFFSPKKHVCYGLGSNSSLWGCFCAGGCRESQSPAARDAGAGCLQQELFPYTCWWTPRDAKHIHVPHLPLCLLAFS